eukprot:7626861-Pyramimonas_sp.AAC.1
MACHSCRSSWSSTRLRVSKHYPNELGKACLEVLVIMLGNFTVEEDEPIIFIPSCLVDILVKRDPDPVLEGERLLNQQRCLAQGRVV